MNVKKAKMIQIRKTTFLFDYSRSKKPDEVAWWCYIDSHGQRWEDVFSIKYATNWEYHTKALVFVIWRISFAIVWEWQS